MATKKKAAAKKKVAVKKAKGGEKVGRAANPETAELRAKLKRMAGRKDGVSNIDAATELGITTLRCSALAKQLADAGEIKTAKADNGRVTHVAV